MNSFFAFCSFHHANPGTVGYSTGLWGEDTFTATFYPKICSAKPLLQKFQRGKIVVTRRSGTSVRVVWLPRYPRVAVPSTLLGQQ